MSTAEQAILDAVKEVKTSFDAWRCNNGTTMYLENAINRLLAVTKQQEHKTTTPYMTTPTFPSHNRGWNFN